MPVRVRPWARQASSQKSIDVQRPPLFGVVRLKQRQSHLSIEDVVTATRHLIEHLSDTLARGQRIEVRGFGSFDVRYRRPRFGHNPKTREPIVLRGRYIPHFKPGIELSAREQLWTAKSSLDRATSEGQEMTDELRIVIFPLDDGPTRLFARTI